MKEHFKELIDECDALLTMCNVPHEMRKVYDGYQIRFPWTDGDVAIHSGTYQNSICLESYQFPWDENDISLHYPRKMAQLISCYYLEIITHKYFKIFGEH